MKHINIAKHIALLFLLPLFLFIISCVKGEDINEITEDYYSFETKAEKGVFEDFFVSESDIANYLSFKSLAGVSRNEKTIVKEVISVKWEDVTCLYIIDYEKGFEVISADKRSPLPLMKSDEGELKPPTEETPLGFHLYTLAEDVWISLYKNVILGEPDQEAMDNMESSLLFWKLISGDYKAVMNQSQRTKASRDTIILDPDSGHWEQIGVSIQTEVYDTCAHLTTTWWHQRSPFNKYCPYYSLGDRSLAGCIAIAGAQMLYFLHYKIGVPEQSPAYGYCNGYVDTTVLHLPYYTQTFGDYSSYTWDYMQAQSDPYPYNYAAKLIGDIGKKVHMHYGSSNSPKGSWSTIDNLRDSAFVAYGIHCTKLNYYSGSFLKGNLSNGYPVVCSGSHAYVESGETKYIGHCFLVDRYIRSRDKTIITYQWVFDDPGQNPGYEVLKTTVIYDTPYITMYQMNWGQGYDNNNDDVWCGMNGSWTYGDYSFTYNRKMLINFSALD